VENNSNRKKVLNILLFVSFLWGAFLVGFFVDHYFNRNQSKNIAIVSNQSNSSNSTNSSFTNESVANENDTTACFNYLNSQNYRHYRQSLLLALQAGQKAVRIYPRSAKAHECLGIAYKKLGHPILSIKELKTAEKLTNDKDTLGTIYLFIGIHYNNFNHPNKALLYFDRELEIARDLNNQEKESAALNNIGLVYLDYFNEQGYDKALEYFNKSLQFTSDPSMITIIYNNIGNVYLDKGDKNKAVEYYKKAVEFAQKADYHTATALDMLNLGNQYTDLKNFSEAQYYLQKGLLMLQKLGDKYWEWEGYDYFGRLYLAQNQKGLAKEYFAKANTLFDAIANTNIPYARGAGETYLGAYNILCANFQNL